MTTFHPFPRLPYTLRARIWKLTVEPRCVDARVRHSYELRHYGPDCPWLVSSTPVPAVLQTCHESRNEGLYQKVFSEIAAKDGSGRRYIWANLELDTIAIGQSYFKDVEPVALTIRRLKFERKNTEEWFIRWESQDIGTFLNLQEVHVICADGLRMWYGASEDFSWPCSQENVWLIDPRNDQIIKAVELDRMMNQEIEERFRQEGEGRD